MPTYEYICTECGSRTEVQASVAQKEKGLKVTCPRCGSGKMAQVFGRFFVMGSPASRGGGSPTGCGPQAGPGCCG